MKKGRPLKYGEETAVIAFRVPKRLKKKLEKEVKKVIDEVVG